MHIEGVCTGAELGKRTYLPGILIRAACPNCGQPYVRDLGDHGLSYPKVGEPEEVHGVCDACEHEWLLGRVVLRLTLEDAAAPGVESASMSTPHPLIRRTVHELDMDALRLRLHAHYGMDRAASDLALFGEEASDLDTITVVVADDDRRPALEAADAPEATATELLLDLHRRGELPAGVYLLRLARG